MNTLGHGSKQTATSHKNSTFVTNNQRKGEKHYNEHLHTLYLPEFKTPI